MQTKRLNVISITEVKNEKGEVVQSKGVVMRVSRDFAAQLVANGTHRTTSKGKLKSFLNKSIKLYNNSRTLAMKKFDIEDKKLGHQVFDDAFTGKTYVALKRGVFTSFVRTNQVNPMTGKPERSVTRPLYQLLVARFKDY